MSHDDEEQPSKGFKFKDNRRFDESGNEREALEKATSKIENKKNTSSSTQAASAPPKSTLVDASGEKVTSEPSGEESEDFQLDFSSFIMSLATQALMQLGAMSSPIGVEIPVDKAAAKQTIDIIAMLQAKTRGNLDTSEQQLLEEILHNLRISFVRGE